MTTVGTLPDLLVTTYLAMTNRDQFRPAPTDAAGIRIAVLTNPDVEFYKSLYRGVGEHLRWRDRLLMPEAELKAALAQPGTTVHVLYVDEAPAGYVELAQTGRETRITYFGLFPAYQGRGLGKYLLSYSLDYAWEQPIDRVLVNTCNLDSPYALENYIKRGFHIYKIHRYPMPERYQ